MTSNGDPAPIGDAEVDRFVHGGLGTRDELLDVFVVGRLARSHDRHRRTVEDRIALRQQQKV